MRAGERRPANLAMNRRRTQAQPPARARTHTRRRGHAATRRWLPVAALALAICATPARADHLSFAGATFNLPPVSGLDGASALVVSPDGRHVYAGAGLDNAVAAFARDATTGGLQFVEVQRDNVDGVDGLYSVFGITISPDGGTVYATSYNDNAVAVFRRDAASGRLTFVEAQRDVGLFGAAAIAVSPDGQTVYAGGFVAGSLVVFARAADTGALTFLERHTDGVAGVDGIQTIRHIAVSPDGRNVYAVGRLDNALAVFGRDGSTGRLTFLTLYRHGVDGVGGLVTPYAVAVSPDGAHVYASSFGDKGLSVFARDAGSGLLTFVQEYFDGVGGVDGLDWPYLVRLSPDGTHVYVIGQTDNALAVFARDPVSGLLTFIEVHKQGVAGVAGLDSAEGLAVSPDGAHVYTCGFADDAIGVFAVQPACPPSPSAGCQPATHSKLRLRSNAMGGTLDWRWSAPPSPPFGDPRQGAGLALCLYGGATRVAAVRVSASMRWQAVTAGAYRYRVPGADLAGVRKLSLNVRRARATLSADISAGLTPLALPVVAQLHAVDTAECWDAAYDRRDVRSNSAERFSARR
jgi:6-phosphogluconolactonase (cycloisomerase 2 family)